MPALAKPVPKSFWGKYRGTVVDIADPLQLARIKAMVPTVLGRSPSVWALPCVQYTGGSANALLMPSIGTSVWIEFEGGDVSYPIWTGCFWTV